MFNSNLAIDPRFLVIKGQTIFRFDDGVENNHSLVMVTSSSDSLR